MNFELRKWNVVGGVCTYYHVCMYVRTYVCMHARKYCYSLRACASMFVKNHDSSFLGMSFACLPLLQERNKLKGWRKEIGV